MILRVERIDRHNRSMTFDVSEIPEDCHIISFGGVYYRVVNAIDFQDHRLMLVRKTSVLELQPSQSITHSPLTENEFNKLYRGNFENINDKD